MEGNKNDPSSRDYRSDWKAFAANDIPTKGIEIKPLERLLALHPPQKGVTRLLDLGCGSGALSHEMAGQGYKVVGVDINKSAIEQASNQHKEREDLELSFLARDSANEGGLDLPCAPFDLVVCQLVISVVGGINERKQLLLNAWNALAPGGSLFVSASGISDAINPQYGQLYLQDAPLTGEDYTYFSRDNKGDILYETHHFSVPELQSLLEVVGFCQVTIETIREASSRRPDQAAYFHYATARKEE